MPCSGAFHPSLEAIGVTISGHMTDERQREFNSVHKMCPKQSNAVFLIYQMWKHGIVIKHLFRGHMASRVNLGCKHSLALETIEDHDKEVGFYVAGKGESLKSFKLGSDTRYRAFL